MSSNQQALRARGAWRGTQAIAVDLFDLQEWLAVCAFVSCQLCIILRSRVLCPNCSRPRAS